MGSRKARFTMNVVLCLLVLASMTGTGPQLASLKPSVEAKLSSILSCKGSHTIYAAKFGPLKDQLAMLIRHAPVSGNDRLHVILTSGRLENPVFLGDIQDGRWIAVSGEELFERQHVSPGPHLLHWSLDGSVVSAKASDRVKLFRTNGGGQCEIVVSDSFYVVGFTRGPTFLVATGTQGGHNFRSYDAECRPTGSVQSPMQRPHAAVSIDGDYLAFPILPSVWMTDAHGGEPQQVRIDWTIGPQCAPMALYTESGRALCISCGGLTRCYDTTSIRRTGVMPENEQGYMVDASSRASRVLFVASPGISHPPWSRTTREFSVWDYCLGEDVMRAYERPWALEDAVATVFALSATGTLAVRAKGSNIRVYELPPDTNNGCE